MEYKVVFRVDELSPEPNCLMWEQGCPLLIKGIQVSRDVDSGEAFLQALLCNLTDYEIQSFKIDFEIEYRDGSTQAICVNPLDADVSPREDYEITPYKLNQGDVVCVSGVVISARSEVAQWTHQENAQPLPRRAVLTGLSDDAMDERSVCLAEMVRNASSQGLLPFRVVRGVAWWLCPCGNLNVGGSSCRSCGSSLSRLLELEDEAFLKHSADERKAKHEQQERERKEKNATAKKKFKLAAASLLAVSLIACVGYFLACNVVLPQLKYSDAMRAIEDGRYDYGIRLFDELGDYRDASEQAESAKRLGKQTSVEEGKKMVADGRYEEGIKKFKEVAAMDEAYEAMYEYATTHLEYEDELTFSYLDELSHKKYKDSASLYDDLYGWDVRLIVNESESDWSTDLTGYSNRKDDGMLGNVTLFAHIEVLSGPPIDGSFGYVQTIRSTGDGERVFDDTTETVETNDSGTLVGQKITTSMSFGVAGTGQVDKLTVKIDNEVVAEKDLVCTDGIGH